MLTLFYNGSRLAHSAAALCAFHLSVVMKIMGGSSPPH